MGGLLEGLPVGQVGAGALVTIIVLLILSGRLKTRQDFLDLRGDRDKWERAATDWQKAYFELGMSFEKQLIQGEATLHALTEIQDAMTRPGVS